VLLRRARRGEEHDVATWPVAGQAPGFFRNFVRALALAGWGRRDRRIGHGWGLDPRRLGLELGRWRRRLRASRALLPPTAIASGLVAPALLAVGGGPVALTGMPASPASCGVLAGRATVPCLGPFGQEPAFTPFEQATPAAGVATATAEHRAGCLTPSGRERKLRMAHGRTCSRAVRRRGGGTSRRHFAPTTWSPVVSN
jgi:hypothetical protein